MLHRLVWDLNPHTALTKEEDALPTVDGWPLSEQRASRPPLGNASAGEEFIKVKGLDGSACVCVE